MKWIFVLVLLVVVLGAAALMVSAARGAWWAARFRTRRRDREPQMRLPAPRCLQCHGTGWLNRDPDRTFTFTGEGFEDKHTAATMCPACGGTGLARERPDRR